MNQLIFDSDDDSNDYGSEENWDFDDPTTSRKKAYLRKKETLEVQNPRTVKKYSLIYLYLRWLELEFH